MNTKFSVPWQNFIVPFKNHACAPHGDLTGVHRTQTECYEKVENGKTFADGLQISQLRVEAQFLLHLSSPPDRIYRGRCSGKLFLKELGYNSYKLAIVTEEVLPFLWGN